MIFAHQTGDCAVGIVICCKTYFWAKSQYDI